MNYDAGTDGRGFSETFVGDFDAGEMAAAVLSDEANLAERNPLSIFRGGRKLLLRHDHADGEAEWAVVEDFSFLIV